MRPAKGSLSAICALSVGSSCMWSSAWSQKCGSLSQCLIVRPLRLPFPPYNVSPVNLNCLSSAVVHWGSTPIPFSGAFTASIEHQCRFSIFAAHAHDSGPKTDTFCLYIFTTLCCQSCSLPSLLLLCSVCRVVCQA